MIAIKRMKRLGKDIVVSKIKGCCPNSKSPGANSKGFLVTILGEAKEQQFPLFEPAGRVWKLREASVRMVEKSFQRAEGRFEQQPV